MLYLLQVDVMGGGWQTQLESRNYEEIARRQAVARLMPMTATRVVVKCQHCNEEVDIIQLSEFDNPNRCPNCHQTW